MRSHDSIATADRNRVTSVVPSPAPRASRVIEQLVHLWQTGACWRAVVEWVLEERRGIKKRVIIEISTTTASKIKFLIVQGNYGMTIDIVIRKLRV